LRLCYIANPNSIHTHRWVRYFAQRGHEVHLVGEKAPLGPPPPEATFYDLTARIDVRKLRYLSWGLAVRRIVRDIRPDLLHAHQVAGAGWLGAAAGYHPFIVTAWGSDLLVNTVRSRPQRLLARWVLGRADYVTCVSPELAQVARDLGADAARVEVAPWGIDTDVFYPAAARPSLRAELGLGPGPVVLSIRGLRPVYNPLDIARAIPQVLARVPEAQFVIRSYTYDPAVLEEFQAIVREQGAAASVHFVGHLPDDAAIADLYRLADVAVSVPASDGTPLSVLEALGCGTATVLSDLPALREWVADEQEGLYVPVGDAQALAAAVVRLLRDEALQSRLKRNGVELVRQRADSRVWMAHAEETYQRLVRQDNEPKTSERAR